MFNVGGGELLVVLLLALVFLGPDRLPDAAKKLGRLLGEARRMTSGFQQEIRSAMDVSGTDDAVHGSEPGPNLIGPPPDLPEPAPGAAAPKETGVQGGENADGPRGGSGHGDTSAA